MSFWDYNDVAAGYFAAAEIAAREKKVGVIAIEVARPDFPVADRSKFADTDIKAAAKGLYVIRDFTPGKPKHGYVVAQGSSATFNLVSILPKLEEAGINVKVISAISEELFDKQPESYRNSVLPPEAVYDLMFVMSGTRRMWPLRNVGPLADEYSMTSDFDNQWLTGGLEPDVIAEAHLDQKSILDGVTRFANDRGKRLERRKGCWENCRFVGSKFRFQVPVPGSSSEFPFQVRAVNTERGTGTGNRNQERGNPSSCRPP